MFCQMIRQWEELKHCQTELLLDNYKTHELKKKPVVNIVYFYSVTSQRDQSNSQSLNPVVSDWVALLALTCTHGNKGPGRDMTVSLLLGEDGCHRIPHLCSNMTWICEENCSRFPRFLSCCSTAM